MNSTCGVSECLGWGPGAGVGCPWAAATLSHVGYITPVGRRLSLDALSWVLYVPAKWRSWTREQGADGGCNAKIEAERLPSPIPISLSLQSFTRRLGEHVDNVATTNSRNSTKAYTSSDLHVSKLTIQSTLLANVRCVSWSLHVLAKHVAKSALLRAKPGYLARKLLLLHQSLYHSTRCYNLKQPRTLAHMSSAES